MTAWQEIILENVALFLRGRGHIAGVSLCGGHIVAIDNVSPIDKVRPVGRLKNMSEAIAWCDGPAA